MMAALAMDHDSSVFPKIAKHVWFYFVLLLLGIVSRHSSAVVAPRFFDHALFAEKVCALYRAFFVGSFEN
jgi:hypothetical protein